jgi:hypothetical protein
MNSYENFKRGLLRDLAKPGMDSERFFQHWQLARDYDIPDAHVRELLLRWASEGLIAIRAWDGVQLREWHRWQPADDLFFNTTDGGYVRIKLLAAGAALVEDLPKREIGFVTA